jgi:hypothetical protein
MPTKKNKQIQINYTNRDFESVKKELVQIAERFYPDTFRDFSEASFGSMMLDSVAYVSDQLSFYIDYNLNEAFLDTSFQYNNVVRHGESLGYKFSERSSTFGKVALFVVVPAASNALGPATNYIPILLRGTSFTAASGLSFILTENVDFSDPRNKTVVAATDQTTGAPSSFAIKAYGTVVSGLFGQEKITVGAFEKFKRIKLNSKNIVEIISVIDSNGNEYFEVDYLAQDYVYEEAGNNNFKNDNVPSILRPKLVQRKFITQNERRSTFLQFGSGQLIDEAVFSQPVEVAANVFGKSYTTSKTFDPTRIHKNSSFGIVPSNTTLTVTFRTTNRNNENVVVGGLNSVSRVLMEFKDRQNLSNSIVATVQNSVEVYNEEPIKGNEPIPTSSELKEQVLSSFPTQERAVTRKDYENLVYRMPRKFGAVRKVSVQRDPSSQKRNLNMYVISTDSFGKLISTNDTIKKNLKTWLNEYRMINDTIDILDTKILNFGVDFTIRVKLDYNKFDVLQKCVEALKQHFSEMYSIGERLEISSVFTKLNTIEGVLDTTSVRIVNKTGGIYSNIAFDMENNTDPTGSYVLCPKNCIFELKYPDLDVKGKIR